MNDEPKSRAGEFISYCSLCRITRTEVNRRGLKVTFHEFPKCPSVRQQWEAFCGGRQPGRFLCSGHFAKSCYFGECPTKVRRQLLKGSVPTIRNPWSAELHEPEPVANPSEPDKHSCFLCRQKVKHHVPIIGGVQPTPPEPMSREARKSYRGSVIVKYFSFELQEMVGEVVCLGCWQKIEEFHQFHGQVEAAHAEAIIPLAYVQVKQEALGGLDDQEPMKEEQLEGLIKVKAEQIVEPQIDDCQERDLEAELEGDDEQNEAESSYAENFDDSSDNEFDKNIAEESSQQSPPKKRSKHKKKTRTAFHKSDQLIAQNCVIICHICSQTFDKFYNLQVHCREVHQTKGRITCCDKDFNERIRLMEHLYSHDNPDLLRCVVCSVVLSCAGNLRRHQLQTHTVFTGTPVNALTCERCSKIFIDRALYNSHVKGHLALETKQYHCKECDVAFCNSFLLKKHVIKRHTLSFDHVCEICGKGFISRNELKAHTKDHDPEATKGRVQCPDCNRSFAKSSLQKHRQMTHASTGPVNCEICGKQAPNRVALGSHKRAVHREAKFSCSVCDKVFKKAITLREHMVTHTGEGSLYSCPHCPKTFNSNANMHSHRKKMHFDEWLQGRMLRQSV